jgi:hypothetical protein
MTSDEELRVLMAHPRIIEHFGHVPNFAELLAALNEFGNPVFEMYDRQSFCAVTTLTADGAEFLVVGQTETSANPAGAGLDCLLSLLRRLDAEVAAGMQQFQKLLGRS